MFVRYLGGGIGHGGNATDMETPTVPDDELDDSPDIPPDNGHGKEGAGGESEDEDDIDGERAESIDGDTESEDGDDRPGDTP